MNQYEIHFIINGKSFSEIITSRDLGDAKRLLLMRYAGAKITSITKV